MLNCDVLKEFLFDCTLRKLSERTMKSYKNNNLCLFRFIEKEYGILELESTTHLCVRGYVEYLTKKNLSEVYINTVIRSFKVYFQYCVEEGYIINNPILKVKRQKEPMVVINTFSDSEVKKMMTQYEEKDFLSTRNRLLLAVLFDTGIRCSELCGLKMTDIRDDYINIYGKGKKIRHVPITPVLYKYIIKYNRIRGYYFKDKYFYDADFYFLSRNGRRLTVEAIERVVGKAGESSDVRKEIRCSPHTARHYYAQAQLRNGIDVYSLSRLLGHSNINITKRYLQSIQDEDILKKGLLSSPLMNL